MNEIVKSTLTQAVTVKKKTSVNEYNEPSFTTYSNVPARKRSKIQLIKDQLGNEVVSDTTVITQMEVTPEDLIDDVQVIAVTNWVDLDGTVIGYKVML